MTGLSCFRQGATWISLGAQGKDGRRIRSQDLQPGNGDEEEEAEASPGPGQPAVLAFRNDEEKPSGKGDANPRKKDKSEAAVAKKVERDALWPRRTSKCWWRPWESCAVWA